MLRTSLDKAYIKRTIRPLYGWTQATPKSAFLDSAFDRSTDIYPGMVLKKTDGETYTLASAATDVPAGLSGLYIGGEGIDEVEENGVDALAVWVLAPDAEFEVHSPAFIDDDGWDDTVETLVHFTTDAEADPHDYGKLCPADYVNASNIPVARLIRVVSTSKIIIGGLTPRTP